MRTIGIQAMRHVMSAFTIPIPRLSSVTARETRVHADKHAFKSCLPCVRARRVRSDSQIRTGTRVTLERKGLRGSGFHACTARRCGRARMRCPWTVGIGVGREACARSDLTLFVTYRQILPYWGCGYSVNCGWAAASTASHGGRGSALPTPAT